MQILPTGSIFVQFDSELVKIYYEYSKTSNLNQILRPLRKKSARALSTASCCKIASSMSLISPVSWKRFWSAFARLLSDEERFRWDVGERDSDSRYIETVSSRSVSFNSANEESASLAGGKISGCLITWELSSFDVVREQLEHMKPRVVDSRLPTQCRWCQLWHLEHCIVGSDSSSAKIDIKLRRRKKQDDKTNLLLHIGNQISLYLVRLGRTSDISRWEGG